MEFFEFDEQLVGATLPEVFVTPKGACGATKVHAGYTLPEIFVTPKGACGKVKKRGNIDGKTIKAFFKIFRKW